MCRPASISASMRRIFFAVATVGALLLFGGAVWAQAFPPAQGFVSDFAGIIDPFDRDILESRLQVLADENGAEVAVVTIITLDGDTIENYAVRLFEAWGIGQAETDNGVLFITAIAERKVRIEVGYGLEPVITDGRAGRILDNEVLPHFRDGDYSAGIMAGAAAIEELIRSGSPPSFIEDNPLRNIFKDKETLGIVLGIASIYMTGWMSRTRSVWLGGVWGAAVGAVLGLGLGNPWALIGLTLGLGLLGLLLDIVLSRNYQSRTSSGLPTTWYSSGGGFRGGSGGSGFGGFSGGASGGGGASRGW
jgi:uncharacterized protein